MSRAPIFLVVSFLTLDAARSTAAADCICLAQGREFALGQSVCLVSPKGPRIAVCGMVLNNTSWQFSETPCVVSTAPVPARDANAIPAGPDGG